MNGVNGFNSTVSYINTEDIAAFSLENDGITIFGGIARTDFLEETPARRANELLIRAVNNRTRERNYFRKYVELLEGEITEEDFDREIDENEDEYVVSTNMDASVDDIKIALALQPHLKDVNDVDDMADIFSFSDKSLRKSIR